MATDFTEQINKMYDSSLTSQKETLAQDYQQADSDLTAEQEQSRKTTQTNLNRTAVEAQKAAVSNAELQNAYGLSSGAKAQARLSLENQTLANMTALRAQQQEADADIERRRSLLAQEYASAIRQAQADNDMQRAQALYDRAQVEDERLNQQKLLEQERAWQVADNEQQRAWQLEDTASERAYQQQLLEAQASASSTTVDPWEAAKFVAEETGDFTLVGQMLGMDQTQINKLNGEDSVPDLSWLYDTSKTGQDEAVTPTLTQTALDFANNVPSWEEIQRTAPGYASYDDYLLTAIDYALNHGSLDEGEAVWLLNRFGLWSYYTD